MFKNFSKILLFSVFITGGCVMVLEISAMRLFAPYFGNTLYTTSSIIGVILGALSLGYYIGGIFADKYPRKDIFFSIIASSGLLVLLLHIIHKILLPLFAYNFPINTGSLIFSLTFFLLPNIFFGILSPFVIKLRSEIKGSTPGRNSGEVFFASTVGSIAGSFLTGFYLIPTFGINQIIISTSVILIFMGVSGLFFYSKFKSLLVVLSTLLLLLINSNIEPKKQGTVYSSDGLYQKIAVVNGTYENKHVVVLYQDLNPSSAMSLSSSDLVFKYTRYIELLRELQQVPKKVLVLGAGAYSIPKYILEKYPDAQIDVVDIEPNLYPVAKNYFNLKETANLTNFVEDGRLFLQKSDKRYDVVFLDVFGSFLSTPSHLATVEFFKLIKERLSTDGIAIANVIGSKEGIFLNSMAKTWKTAFLNNLFYAVEGRDFKGVQNFIFVGCLNNCDFSYQEDKKISILTNLKTKTLTDDYAPTDYLINLELSKN